MSIIRTKKSSRTPFVMLDTTALNDDHLSFRAKGLHAYLMSKPDGWQVHIKHLEQRSPSEGREAISSALKELGQAGYLHRERVRGDDGRLAGWATTVYETPQHPPGDTDKQSDHAEMVCSPSSPKTGLPTSVQPKSVQPKSANPHLVSIDLRSKALNEVKTPNPTSGEQNIVHPKLGEQSAEGLGVHIVCSGDDSSMAAAPQMLTTLPKNSRAYGTNRRAVEAREQEAIRQKAQGQVEACPYCDTYGYVPLMKPDGTYTNLRCTHGLTPLLDYLDAHQDLTWPHAPPPHDAGPAP